MNDSVLSFSAAFNKADFIIDYKALWKLNALKNVEQLITLSIVTLITAGLGFLTYVPGNPVNVFFYMTFVALALVIILFMGYFGAKSAADKSIEALAEKYAHLQMDTRFELSEERFRYWDPQKHLDYSWNVFSSYSYFKGYLILWAGESPVQLFRNDASETYSARLNELVAAKLPIKHIRTRYKRYS